MGGGNCCATTDKKKRPEMEEYDSRATPLKKAPLPDASYLNLDQNDKLENIPSYNRLSTLGVDLTYDNKFKNKVIGSIEPFISATNDLNDNNDCMMEAINLYLEMLHSQRAVLMTMSACSQPSNMDFLLAIPKENKKKIMEL